PRKREAVRRRKWQKIMYPSYGMEVRFTELETSVTRGCRSLQGYTEEFVCGIQSSYFRMEVTDVLMWFALSSESVVSAGPAMERRSVRLQHKGEPTTTRFCAVQHEASAAKR